MQDAAGESFGAALEDAMANLAQKPLQQSAVNGAVDEAKRLTAPVSSAVIAADIKVSVEKERTPEGEKYMPGTTVGH